MAEYRIIALDLDGTLLTTERTITPKTLDLLLRLQAEGYKVVISTGRPVIGAEPTAVLLHLQENGGYVMAYNGALVIDWQTRQAIYSQYLQPEAIGEVYRYAKEAGFALVCYHDEFLVSDHELNHFMEQSVKRNGLKFKKVDNFLEEATYPLCKCMIIGEPDGLHVLEERILETHPTTFNVYRSEPYFLEVVPPNIDKASGLRVLLEHLQMPATQLIAFGDSYNDIPMIRLAGMGVAMGNAPQVVKDTADYVASTNDDEGVARTLISFIN